MKKIDLLYKDICRKYFPLWKPWPYTYNKKWMNSGYCNANRKHIFLGAPNPLLIIHEICHAVSTFGHGTRWQNRMLQAADMASRYDPRLSERIKIQVRMYRHLQHNPQEEMKSLYLRIEDTFSQLCLERENADTMITTIEDKRVLKDLLIEIGYRKEWDDTKYEKMLKKGMKIADTVRNSCTSERNLPRNKPDQMRIEKIV
jgi:hypothetical protein